MTEGFCTQSMFPENLHDLQYDTLLKLNRGKGRPAGRLVDFLHGAGSAQCSFFYWFCDKRVSKLHEERGHIYVACVTILLISNVIWEVGRTVLVHSTALMCSKGVLACSWILLNIFDYFSIKCVNEDEKNTIEL